MAWIAAWLIGSVALYLAGVAVWMSHLDAATILFLLYPGGAWSGATYIAVPVAIW